MLVLVCAIASAQPSGDNSSAFDLPENLYPVTTWEPIGATSDLFGGKQNGLTSVRDCGFNVAAFIRHEHIDSCERLGLLAMISEPFPEALKKWAALNDEQIESRVRRIIGDTAARPSILGYFLEDEPGASEFPALAKAVQMVRKLAPGKLAYINLFPDYAIVGAKDISQLETSTYDEYLSKYVNIVKPQFISYDNYQIQYSNDQMVTPTAASYYRNLLAVRKCAFENKLPFWNILASNQIQPQFPVPSPASLQLQAFTTLAAGARGLTWYTYYSNGYQFAPVDTSGTRTATWLYLRMVNEQVRILGPMLRKLVNNGVYFTQPQPAAGLPQLPGAAVQSITADSPLMVGEFAAPQGEKYAMAVNLSLAKSTRMVINPKPPLKLVRHYSPVNADLRPLPPDGALWLTAGQGVLLKLD